MSYPSVENILSKKDIQMATASQEQLDDAMWEAFGADLPEGRSYVENMAKEIKRDNTRKLYVESPGSTLGQQIIRLLGTDIARGICQRKLGVAFGLYNCCAPVGAPEEGGLKMSVQEQIALQNGDMASADC